MEISIFLITSFFSITSTFIDDFTLNIDDIKEFWSFGLCWPLLAFVALDEFVKQKLVFLVKSKHNWPVSISQMSKPISKWDWAF
jgi:hypothetical protein